MLTARGLDAAVARVEGAIAALVLLAMVLVASAQALLFNLAGRDLGWARMLLDELGWADSFLQKGTLWLAFLGASLATHQNKHIGVDVLPRLSSGRRRAGLESFAALGAGVIALLLAGVYFEACLVADAAVPFEYEHLTTQGPTHVCDAAPSELLGTSRPALLCTLRAGLAALGISVSSGAGIAQLIAPVMFIVIGLRLLARGVRQGLSCLRGAANDDDGERPPAMDPEPPGSVR
jgi:TRAP-type C4-dicarboxylate transport system permease small subunit